MDGPDYAEVPEYVKVYLRRGGDAAVRLRLPISARSEPVF
jgi:hypothetical protein